jgi:hypothetical protein
MVANETMLFFRSDKPLVLAMLATACGAVAPSPDGGADSGRVTDAKLARDAPIDSPKDGSTHDPCAPGTCRFDTSSKCLPPGGPISELDSGSLSGCCACGDDGLCSSPCTCASPDTPIATPLGERPIASLAVGDLVMSIDHGRMVSVPVREIHHTPVLHHRVIEVVLRDGPTLRISAAHPTADGRFFGELRAGEWLGGREVTSAKVVPYAFDATYDILPDSDTGTYFAGGALIGSTLTRHASNPGETCWMPQAVDPD